MDIHPGLANGRIYLDYNATTPTDPRVVEAMLPYLTTHFGNPSSTQAHVVTQTTEHPAVLATYQALHRLHGVEVAYLPVEAEGRVDPQELAAAITDHTVLVSIMLANNETGTIQPITELARITHEHGVLSTPTPPNLKRQPTSSRQW